MELASINQLNLMQQAELFRQVAQVYVENKLCDDEDIGSEFRRALQGAFGIGFSSGRTPLVIGNKVYLGSRALDLSLKPQMLKLFETFLQHGNAFMRRDDLLAHIYDIDVSAASPRYLASLRSNLVKLVSRARTLANQFLGESSEVQEWFVHDYKTRSWALFRRGDGESYATNVKNSEHG